MTASMGALAPALVLENCYGTPFELGALRGRKVLLAFLRNAHCAVCNLWVHETAQRAQRWRELGLEVVAVFESPSDRLRAQFTGREVPFEILADPDGSAHDTFGSPVDAARVQAVIANGSGHAALARAAAAGFPPRTEEGANFFRLPTELLIDAAGRVMHVHVADEVANHLSPAQIEKLAFG